ncbi:c-type cytochrome [Prosthecodimorpha staleyi]|uniref:Cytochrome c n=1 Tax=Prosthecodimorpha staleyi TaxID=2840188 RepID=A0A947DAI9_9HYPH|nr:cytochrome c [Prosthecodimorpha staleyi]MBT9291642.1 cytochrome c [Prosthecodimorpha staleyi]
MKVHGFGRGAALAAVVAVGSGLGGPAAAETSLEIGRSEFAGYCAACHGHDGRGDGPFQVLLTRRVPGLTGLARANGGRFPAERVAEVVRGSVDMPGHGPMGMPLWGDHYRTKAPSQLGPYFKPEDAEAYVKSRIQGVVDYLATIQEK